MKLTKAARCASAVDALSILITDRVNSALFTASYNGNTHPTIYLTKALRDDMQKIISKHLK